jgi:hypothetical protein
MIVPIPDLDGFDFQALKPAFDLSETETVEDYERLCKNDFAQAWVKGNFRAITIVQATKTGSAIKIVAVTGEYDSSLIDEIESFGQKIGCNKICFTGRKGWLRKRPDFRLRTMTFEKEL